MKFAGIEGKVIEQSQHGNYVVLQLSERISITGTFSNIWNWQEIPDEDSGFISFITYIGLNSISEAEDYQEWITDNEGYFKSDEEQPRPSKRTSLPFEIKVRGLSPIKIVELLQKP